MRLLDRLKRWAEQFIREVHALYLAARDPRTPWYAKAVAAVVVGYALSPIDLIPDFIPVLGYLDDLVLLPLGIYLALHLIPDEVMARARRQSHEASQVGTAASRVAGVVVVLVWLLLLVGAGWLAWSWWRGGHAVTSGS